MLLGQHLLASAGGEVSVTKLKQCQAQLGQSDQGVVDLYYPVWYCKTRLLDESSTFNKDIIFRIIPPISFQPYPAKKLLPDAFLAQDEFERLNAFSDKRPS